MMPGAQASMLGHNATWEPGSPMALWCYYTSPGLLASSFYLHEKQINTKPLLFEVVCYFSQMELILFPLTEYKFCKADAHVFSQHL